MEPLNRCKPFYALIKLIHSRKSEVQAIIYSILTAGTLLENRVAELEKRIEELENRS